LSGIESAMCATHSKKILLGFLLLGAGLIILPVHASESWMYVQSDFHDYIGDGGEYFLDLSNSVFSLSGVNGDLTLHVSNPQGDWNMRFYGAGPFTNGPYVAAPPDPSHPFLNFSAADRACDTPTGQFDIVEIAFDTNNVPVSFWARFDQYCAENGFIAGLHGEARVNAHPPVVLNFPSYVTVDRDQHLSFTVTAASTNGGRVTLTAGSLPNGATFTDNGDSTATFLWTPSWNQIGNTRITVHGADAQGASDNAIIRMAVAPSHQISSLAVGDPSSTNAWPQFGPGSGTFTATEGLDFGASVHFVGTNSITYDLDFVGASNLVLAAGDYKNAVGYILVYDHGLPALDVRGNGLDCIALNGDFAVKQIVYGFTNDILALWATFDQSCGPVRGEIKYNADAPVTLSTPPHAAAVAGYESIILVSASEIDGNPVMLTAQNLPNGATFTDNSDGTGQLTWTPQADQTGDYSVIVVANNSAGQFDTGVITIKIAPTALTRYFIQEHALYFQKNKNAAILLPHTSPYVFDAEVVLTTNFSVTTASLADRSSVQHSLSLQSDEKSFALTQQFTNQVGMTSAFPPGSYQLLINTARGDSLALPLVLPPANFPSSPHVNNWPATQVINPNDDLVLTWDALPGGTSNDFVSVEIFDISGSQVFYSSPDIFDAGSLNGTSTAVTIPAHNLVPGQTYLGILSQMRVPGGNSTNYPFAKGYAGVSTDTAFELKTIKGLQSGSGHVVFSSSRYLVNDKVRTATISIMRTGGNTLPISVLYATSNATAQAGIDYTSVSGTLVFSNGVTSQEFTIPIAPGSGTNGTKTVTLLLRPIINGKPHGKAKATLYIQPD
jgi:Calx-beta domain/Putative Ig domain/Bacterial Ig domain